MTTNSEIILQRNINLGKKFNLLIGDVPSLASPQEYLIDLKNNPQRWFNTNIYDFTSTERRNLNAAINSALRAGFNTVGSIRISTLRQLDSVYYIGTNRAKLLEEAFKHPNSS